MRPITVPSRRHDAGLVLLFDDIAGGAMEMLYKAAPRGLQASIRAGCDAEAAIAQSG